MGTIDPYLPEPGGTPVAPSVGQLLLQDAFREFLGSTEVVGRRRKRNLIARRLAGTPAVDLLRAALLGADPDAPAPPSSSSSSSSTAAAASSLPPDVAASEKLQILRRAAHLAAAADREGLGERLDAALDAEIDAAEAERDKARERWDVETVLSTYSNIYNRPALISAASGSTPRFRLARGVPVAVVDAPPPAADADARALPADDEDESEDDDDDLPRANLGAARSKHESKEEKKARKAAVKASRKNRRSDKKELKTTFRRENHLHGRMSAGKMEAVEKALVL
ncbi:hypothetical protein HK405_001416 [Cladochytrium tenue]|nr:hypothetical protein HK405_001416 [Cladochytrium tenue]